MAHHGSEREREARVVSQSSKNESEVHFVRVERACSAEWFTMCHPVCIGNHSVLGSLRCSVLPRS